MSKKLMTFINCGDPNLLTTKRAIFEIKDLVDSIMLGIPFSDPIAEDDLIEEANERALKKGIKTDDVFDLLVEIKDELNTKITIRTYANVVFAYGIEKFMDRANKANISGIVLLDVPHEEKGEFEDIANKYFVDIISIIAPSAKSRLPLISKDAKGFIYLLDDNSDIKDTVTIIKEYTDIPCILVTRCQDIESLRNKMEYTDGLLLEGNIELLFKEYKEDAPKYIKDYIMKIREVM